MLIKVKNNYKSILKYFDFDESISYVNYKKQKLIEMAKNGEVKPYHKTKLGRALRHYTSKSSDSYCHKFDIIIRKLEPSWFLSKKQIAHQKMQKFIQMAIKGTTKPSWRTKEGQSLFCYTCKSSKSYCHKFDTIIRKLAPSWFVSKKQIASRMKQKFIQMAIKGTTKPSWRTKEGKALNRYTRTASGSYCPKFDKTIKRLAPSWFVRTRSTQSRDMKQKLIKMAKDCETKPNWEAKEGQALSRYTRKSSKVYCSKFDKTIRKLRPDWFHRRKFLFGTVGVR